MKGLVKKMSNPGDKFYINARGVTASGMVTKTGFLVFAGSYVMPTHKPYLSKRIVKHRDKCREDGTIVDNYLTRDVEFGSSSTAAYFLLGSNASGPATWKNADGITMAKLKKVSEGIIPRHRQRVSQFLQSCREKRGQ